MFTGSEANTLLTLDRGCSGNLERLDKTRKPFGRRDVGKKEH